MTETKLTPEQIAEDERQAIVSKRFLGKHPTFKQCKANIAVMFSYLKNNDLDWSDESLEEAYENSQTLLHHATRAEIGAMKHVAPASIKSEFPWPMPLTARIIGQMPRELYKQFSKDPEFRRQVNALGLKKS